MKKLVFLLCLVSCSSGEVKEREEKEEIVDRWWSVHRAAGFGQKGACFLVDSYSERLYIRYDDGRPGHHYDLEWNGDEKVFSLVDWPYSFWFVEGPEVFVKTGLLQRRSKISPCGEEGDGGNDTAKRGLIENFWPAMIRFFEISFPWPE